MQACSLFAAMTNEDLKLLGETLRHAREAQALSLEEVEVQTRIRVKFLQALENGDISGLPSAAHARGFLRNYAQFLRLDASAIIARFVEATGSVAVPVTRPLTPPGQMQPTGPHAADSAPAAHPTPKTASPLPRPRSIYVEAAQRSGPAVPLSLAQPQPTQITKPEKRHSPAGRVMHSSIFTAGVLLLGFMLIVWWTTSQLGRISGEALAPVGQESTFLEEFSASETVAPTPTFRPTSTLAAGGGVAISDRVLLVMSVIQPTWVRVTVDGSVVFEGQAQPGHILRYEGRQEIYVRAGNGAGLLINYNGQDIGPLGQRGEVVERFFMIGGQITPTPTPTLTPTNTSVPTPTPNSTSTP